MSFNVSTHSETKLTDLDGHIARWFHAPVDFSLSRLRDQVVLVHTFQMLCPGCVLHALPQAARVAALGIPELVVIGLHTVFEHHQVMDAEALAVFLAEYRITYPVAVDRRLGDDPVPSARRTLALRGTPTSLLFDRQGSLRQQRFGAIDDLALGCLIGSLLAENDPATESLATTQAQDDAPVSCSAGVCAPINERP